MRHKPASVTLLPQDLTVDAELGETVLDAVLQAVTDFPWLCGGNCSCTTCAVEVLAGAQNLSTPEWPELDRLRDLEHANPNVRLACQALLTGGDVTVRRWEESEG